MLKVTSTFSHKDFEKVDGKNTRLNYLLDVSSVDYDIFVVYNNGVKYAELAIGFVQDAAEIHFEHEKLSKSRLKHIMTCFEDIKKYCKDQGAKTITAPKTTILNENTDSWSRFVRLLGFENIYTVNIADVRL